MSRQRSASGARIAGDDLQFLVAWIEVLRALLPRSDVTAIAIEAQHAGNVDDVVVHHADAPDEYMQVKFAVDAKMLVNLDLLMKVEDSGSSSLIQKFHASWKTIGGRGRSEMQLVTNRAPDPDDPLCSLLNGRDSKLTYALERGTSRTNKARDELTEHLDITDKDLVEMLEHLTFRCGESYASLLRHAADLMNSLGMASDRPDVERGMGLVREWVAQGQRLLTVEDAVSAVDGLGLRREDPMPVFLVQAISEDAYPDEADVALNWVDHYLGEAPAIRRELVDRDLYLTTLQPQLLDAAEELLRSEPGKVFVKGAMRLDTWFAVGAALPKVRGVELSCRQKDRIWSTDDDREPAEIDVGGPTKLDRGADLAVIVSVSDDASIEALNYVAGSNLSVSRVVEIRLVGGVSDEAVSGGGHAVSAAAAIRNAVRKLVAGQGADAVHLFLATPASLALFLGHRWNRIAPTTVYADLGAGRGYAAAFRIDA